MHNILGDVIFEDDIRFQYGPIKTAHTAHGAEVIAKIEMDQPKMGLDLNVKEVSEEDRQKLAEIAPAVARKPYQVGAYQLVRIPNATVYNFPRIEGMVCDSQRNFIRETRGSPRILEGNKFIRYAGNRAWYFEHDFPYDGEIKSAFLPFDPGTHNYAHFLGLYVQRVIVGNSRLKNCPVLFPDLPGYRAFSPGAMRNEFFYRLPEIFPLAEGNFYFPLPAGKFKVNELYLLQHLGDRWDLVFYNEVLAELNAIGAEALRRHSSSLVAPLPRRFSISRKNAQYRRILNEEKVNSVLQKFDYSIMQMEKIDFWGQVAHFAAAEKIIGLHGAGCANIVFTQNKPVFIEIFPKPLPSLQFLHSAIAKDCNYVPFAQERQSRLNDVIIDCEKLEHLLALQDRNSH
ncbi:hypothetical protein CR162_21755 [Pseudoroseomonas rhizosphaerae]|uniref:Glycosyltransferase 61 catalytic domain-containing protein n=1 Tax=Teichococcus rhizosphaerae TaxID=1335062 RepID=A0A2C6ZYH6_9PROT|nr:glycosyltransferase family 61 protein [Pseudoroseomonas rhizosphaerae]PHK92858.1 hypothetical protein CR162_21755 [Pseudoroseomonas rhizosphaerae]